MLLIILKNITRYRSFLINSKGEYVTEDVSLTEDVKAEKSKRKISMLLSLLKKKTLLK